MVVPNPPMKLEGHCSVIHENTLYVYSADGFASIPLQRNGTWSKLKMGEAVSGARCVSAGVNGSHREQALYVVGGTGSSEHYPGFQRYSFQRKQWETLTPNSPVTWNRTDHGAVYLKSPSLILMYAGTQRGSSTPSSDTFTIDTAPPYTVLGYSTKRAKPDISPILLPWSDNEAALIGGTTDKKIHIFHPARPAVDPWSKPIASLGHMIPDDVQCALLKRPDGSKILETFNMSASPNTVASFALVGPRRKPAKHGNIMGGLALKKRTKGSSVSNYSTYDDQFAPRKMWKDYSLAQGDNNLVAISGGSGTDTVAIFNQTSDSWLNATKLFYGDKTEQQILGPTRPTTTSSSTPTSTPSHSIASPTGGSSSNVGIVIGAVLGGLAVIAVILLIILLCLRRVKKRRAVQDGADDDKMRLSFQDRGEVPLTRSAYPMARSQVPVSDSFGDSPTFFPGKAGGEKPPQHFGGSAAYGQGAVRATQNPLSEAQPSRLVRQANGRAFEAREAGRAGDRRTDEGWSKYFVGNNSATDLARQSDRSLSGSDFGNSESKENSWPMKPLTPLNFGFLDGPRPLGQVVSGSPTRGPSPTGQDGQGLVIREGQSAQISSADSLSILSDDRETRQEGHASRSSERSWLGRPPSSNYSSVYYAGGRETMTSNGRRSSLVIPESLEEREQREQREQRGGHTVNSDMSWLNLNGER